MKQIVSTLKYIVLSFVLLLSATGCVDIIPERDVLRQPETYTLDLSALPEILTIVNTPTSVGTIDGNGLRMASGPKTNLFNNPNGQSNVHSAPMALFQPEGDFVLRARVRPHLEAVYDVAALVVYFDDQRWAKLCFENSVKKQPTVVSVVTRGLSDDCNSQSIDADSVYLSLARKGDHYSMHWSLDGSQWDMVRDFNLKGRGTLKAGFAVHGSRGSGTWAEFTEIQYTPNAPEAMR